MVFVFFFGRGGFSSPEGPVFGRPRGVARRRFWTARGGGPTAFLDGRGVAPTTGFWTARGGARGAPDATVMSSQGVAGLGDGYVSARPYDSPELPPGPRNSGGTFPRDDSAPFVSRARNNMVFACCLPLATTLLFREYKAQYRAV